MPTGYDAGEAFIRVSGNFDGLIRQFEAEATRDARAFRAAFEQELRGGWNVSGPSPAQSTRQGEEAGGAFARSFRARVEAALKSLPNIQVDANTNAADARLAELRRQLVELSGKRIGVDIDDKTAAAEVARISAELDSLARKSPNVSVRVDAKAASAELAAVQAQITGLDTTVKSASKDSGGLLQALIPLAPAVVPLAGAAGLAGAAMVSMGAQGLLAAKGIQAAMKASTAEGVQFAAGVNTIKGDLAQLEGTAAHGVLSAFGASITQLHADVPALNADLAQSSKIIGDIGGHLLSAAIGGEHSFAPALLSVEQVVDKLAGRFEAWATGPGGTAFGQTLARDFAQVEPVVEDLATGIAHLIGSMNSGGLGVIAVIDDIAKALDSIPTPVLTTLVDGIVALKAVTLVSAMFDRFAISVRSAAVAEGEAEVASTGLRAGLAGGIGFLGKAAAGWIGVSLAINAAASATSDLKTNSDGVERFVGQLGGALQDLSHADFSKLGSDVWGANRKAAEDQAAYTKSIQQGLFDQATHLNEVQYQTVKAQGSDLIVSGTGHLSAALAATAGALSATAAKQTIAAQIQTAYGKYTDQTTEALNRQAAALSRAASSGTPVSQLASAYQATTTAIQGQITSTEKFLGLGGQTVETYHGMKIGANTYAAALQQTGGDLEKATGLVHASVDGLDQQKTALAATAAEQQRVGTYVSDVATKYGLTASQVDIYSQALGINFDELGKSADVQKAAERAMGDFVKTLSNGNSAITGWVAALAQFNQAGDSAASRAQLIGAALVSFNGDAIGFESSVNASSQAVHTMQGAFQTAGTSIINLKTGSIDYTKVAAGPLLQSLQGMQTAAMGAATAMYQHERATVGSKQAADDAYKVYQSKTAGSLDAEAQKLGLTADQAKKLSDRYFGMPKDVKTQIEALGAAKTDTLLNAIGKQLSYLTGHAWNPIVGAIDHASATIGRIRGELSNLNGSTANVYVVTSQIAGGGQHSTKYNADGGVLDFYANGGVREQHVAQIAPAGAMRVWAEPETGGEAYIPLAPEKRGRSQAVAQETVSRLGGVAYFADGGMMRQLAGSVTAAPRVNQMDLNNPSAGMEPGNFTVIAQFGDETVKAQAHTVYDSRLKAQQRQSRGGIHA